MEQWIANNIIWLLSLALSVGVLYNMIQNARDAIAELKSKKADRDVVDQQHKHVVDAIEQLRRAIEQNTELVQKHLMRN
jgi:translation initiation factor 2B subunit (eIF-2B alpha/beta/delta family)